MRVLTSEILGSVGKEIELSGWVAGRRNHGKIIFIDLRDAGGVVQLVFTPQHGEVYELADSLRAEWVISVAGEVKERPDGMENPELETGKHEVAVSKLTVLTRAETPPFPLDTDGKDIGEDIRMKYRYLDIRRRRLTMNLKMRNKIIQFMRTFLIDREFTEVETPILGKSTPEGARDYLVPSRLHHGEFYALPQSPQQYKQLLMVAGLEKYFQIARCFRDEDTRGDRQPEFTQLDVEMSFVSQEEILEVIEVLFLELVKKLYPGKKLTLGANGRIPRITHTEAMEQYNTDRPDVRKNQDDPNELAFLFVTDFPAFERSEGKNRWQAAHHPFTMPQVSSVQELKEQFANDPGALRAYQYDMVLNGYEVGGGSVRIHDPELLSAVFEVLGHGREQIEEQFGHLLEAFRYGVPPHGGIALGLDRIAMVFQNEETIREVIAFPKTGDGRDLLMGAPSAVDKEQLDELHIKIKK